MDQTTTACTVCGAPAAALLPFAGFTVFACPACGHEFSAGFAEGGLEAYDPAYFTRSHANWFNNPDTALHAMIAEAIADRFGRDASVIDIGCGNGNFLKHLASRGFTNLTGLDILDQDLPGIRYLQTPIEAYAGGESFDAVVSLANIEHIADVRAYLRLLAGLLEPGGLLVVYTVDNGSLLYRLAKALFALGVPFAARRLYDPHHLNHFSVASLAGLAARSGLAPAGLTRRNIPGNAVDLPPGPLRPVLAAAVAAIDVASCLVHREMLQLALFTRAPGR